LRCYTERKKDYLAERRHRSVDSAPRTHRLRRKRRRRKTEKERRA